MTSFAAVVVVAALFRKFWQKEAQKILASNGQLQSDKHEVELTERKLKYRFSFNSYFNLFEETNELHAIIAK